jgi:CBS-domain-containing membrane protein
MKVGTIMTRAVIACPKDADIGMAARLMSHGRFGTLPVVDANGKVAGVITDRDIAMAAATRQRNAAHIGVHEAMSDKVRSCFEEDEVGAALKQMVAGHVRRLPVLDAASHLAGILSIDDILREAVGHTGGVSSSEFLQALRMICAQPRIEPTLTLPESFTSG